MRRKAGRCACQGGVVPSPGVAVPCTSVPGWTPPRRHPCSSALSVSRASCFPRSTARHETVLEGSVYCTLCSNGRRSSARCEPRELFDSQSRGGERRCAGFARPRQEFLVRVGFRCQRRARLTAKRPSASRAIISSGPAPSPHVQGPSGEGS